MTVAQPFPVTSITFTRDQPFTLDIIVKGDIIDTCIDQRRTMITRRDPEPDGDRLFFFAEDGEVTFEDIVVRPLNPAKD